MGRKSRADLISELKTAGAKGSLSKMNRTKLAELHAQMIPQGGGAGQMPSVAPIAGSIKTKVASETGAGQRPSTTSLRIDPDEDDISDYLEGGGWWKNLAGDVSRAGSEAWEGAKIVGKKVESDAKKAGKAVAKTAKEFQHSQIGKDIEIGAVDVGEVSSIAVGDAALLASTAVDGPAGVAASAALDAGVTEGASALRDKIKES